MRADLFTIDTALLTDQTVVRRFREGDGDALYELVQDNHVFLADHFPKLLRQVTNVADTERYVRRQLAYWLLQQEYSLGVWTTDDGRLIGQVRLFHIDWEVPQAEISFFLDRNYTGRGIMTEVLALVVRFAFRQLQLEKISLRTLADNYASQRLARRIGFRREGDLRNEFRKTGGILSDVMLFGLTREERGD